MSESNSPQDPSTDPQAAGGADPQAGNGTDGNTSNQAVQTDNGGAGGAGGAQQQPGAGSVTPQPALGRSEDEIRSDERRRLEQTAREEQRQRDLAAAQEDLREYRRKSPAIGRDAMEELNALLRDTYGSDVYLTPEMRKPFLDLIETANLKAERAAKLELQDSTEADRKLLIQTSNAFYDAFETPEDKKAFSDSVKGSEGKPEVWVKNFGTLQREIGQADALLDFVEKGSALLGEGVREDYLKAVKDVENIDAFLTAFRDAAAREGNAAPTPEGRIARLPGNTGGKYRTHQELDAAKLRGELTDAQYLEESNKFLGVTT